MERDERKLEAAVRGLTAEVPVGGAWERALERVRAEPAQQAARRAWAPVVFRVAAVIGIGAVLVGVLLPAQGKARSSSARVVAEAQDRARAYAYPDADGDGTVDTKPISRGMSLWLSHAGTAFEGFEDSGGGFPAPESAGVPSPRRSQDGEPGAERHVVRTARVEVTVEDVRAAFLRAQALVSAARGEFVGDSQARDRGDGVLEADLTLRVQAARLGEVLNEVRALGEVRHERSGVEDVTGQVVDLEARLTAERAVEAELLTLLREREDDDLEDILRVRRELGEVRGRIERYQGQRQRLGALVRLATVTVVLRQDRAPVVEEREETLGAWFSRRMGEAWDGGVRALLGTMAAIVEIVIGGLVWWAVVGLVVVAGWRAWRRARPRALPERA